MNHNEPDSQFKPNTTVAAVIHCDGKFLLVQEHDDTGAVVFNQPAGHLEAGENLIAAVQREILEETGLALTPQYLCGIYYYHRPELKLYFLRFCFVIELEQQLVAKPQDDDIIAGHWFSIDEIKAHASQLRSPMVMECLQDYLDGKKIPLNALKSNL